MRRRTILLTALILVVLGISAVSLALPEIHIAIPGLPRLDRAETGPLGLKLGLDLQGGAHLVYQAQTGTTLAVTFPDDVEVDTEAVQEALAGADYQANVVQIAGGQSFEIEGSYLDPEPREAVRLALVNDIGEPTEFVNSDLPPPTSDQMDGVLDIISRRVNLYGTEEPIVQRFGDDRIIVQLPGASGSVVTVRFSDAADVEKLGSVVDGRGYGDTQVVSRDNNEYRVTTENTLSLDQRQQLRAILEAEVGTIEDYQVTGGIEDAKRLIGETAQLEFLRRQCAGPVIGLGCVPPFTDSSIGLTGDDLVDAYASTDQVTGLWVVNIQFNNRGAEIFSDMTEEINVQTNPDSDEVIAVILDDQQLIAPVARAHIRDGRSQISGDFDRERARTLAVQLKSGSLPVPLTLIQESNVDALYGAESLQRSLMAGLVGLGLVLVFVIAYYRAAGVVAAVALICYSVVTLAIFKLVPITLTLPHIGGFILSIGLAVDANILIFERIKEEIRLGRGLASAMDVGFNRAWPAIRDGNVSTLITCVVLLWFGNRLGGGLINGFALTLLVGVLVSMFTAVLVSRNLLQALQAMGLGRMSNLFTPEKIQPRASEQRPRSAP
ncbi:MAG: protein translocase subunit SecD [Chloroflexota bacterium]|nr:protein translocase subunit SecD [Chloroflexota bacterium]MDE2682788.1 protein translocase subunit SecD [Chloroflexota bacterium]